MISITWKHHAQLIPVILLPFQAQAPVFAAAALTTHVVHAGDGPGCELSLVHATYQFSF